jgi:hypothetical protein
MLVPFIAMTLFTSYFLFGDFSLPDFKKISFMLLRILGSIFRGTIENEDFNTEFNKSEFQKSIYFNLEYCYTQIAHSILLNLVHLIIFSTH